MTLADPAHWRDALAAMRASQVSAILTVQCDLYWLRPRSATLRDDIDEAITELALRRMVRIDRIMLHSLPAVGDLPPGELQELNATHADWLRRLATVAELLPEGARPRVHRVIVGGRQHTVEAVDGIELQINGTWAHPGAASAALDVVRRGATTPLTGSDINTDGPFGDADPSVYL